MQRIARYGHQPTSILLFQDRFDIVTMALDKPNARIQFSEVYRNLKIIRTHQCAFQVRHRSIVYPVLKKWLGYRQANRRADQPVPGEFLFSLQIALIS